MGRGRGGPGNPLSRRLPSPGLYGVFIRLHQRRGPIDGAENGGAGTGRCHQWHDRPANGRHPRRNAAYGARTRGLDGGTVRPIRQWRNPGDPLGWCVHHSVRRRSRRICLWANVHVRDGEPVRCI